MHRTGGGSNSYKLTPIDRSGRLKEFLVSPVAAIFGAKPDAQILGVILRGFHKNRGFTGDFNFMRERPQTGKNNPKTRHFKAERDHFIGEKPLKVPETLKAKGPGRKFWRDIHKEFELRDSHHLRLLQEAAHCLDVIEAAQEEIQEAGSFYKDRFGQPRSHPGFDIIKAYRALFIRTLRELGLDMEPPQESRPPRLY
jgi:hypothetical protein